MLFITEGFPSVPFKPKFSWETKEYILVELNLRKRNWLIICIRNLHKNTIYSYLKIDIAIYFKNKQNEVMYEVMFFDIYKYV